MRLSAGLKQYLLHKAPDLMLVGYGPELENAFSNPVYNAVCYTPAE
ncbi:MAG: hypothetical protein ABW166_12510 [Sedimenticola sp.]